MSEKNRILVVEDEITTLKMVTESLKKENYAISIAKNGKEAIMTCRQEKPDLILMDVMMPEMNGYQACREIKEQAEFADLPIIFLTSADTFADEQEGLEAGAIDYLAKPVNLTLLKMRVSNHLEMKRKNDLVKAQKAELEEALTRIKRLEGIITICMYCKSIRNDKNSWERLEQYFEKHSDARFSHGICDDCKALYFPSDRDPKGQEPQTETG